MSHRERRAGPCAAAAAALILALPRMTPPARAAAGDFQLRPAEQSLPALMLAQAAPATQPAGENAAVERKDVEEAKTEEPSLPLSFNITYYLYSDYVWRGMNFSEHEKEGREKLNHQITTSLSYSFGDYGSIGFDTFFEWYRDQEKINPYAQGELQEIDYYIWYSYEIKPIFTTATLSYNFYTYPKYSRLLNRDRDPGNNHYDRTHEWQITLAHNDAWMWKWLFPENEDGVLNPELVFAQDVGMGAGACFVELGLSHPFTFDPLPDLTITPNYKIGGEIDGYNARILQRPDRYRNTTRLTYQQVGLDLTYDVTKLLHLPSWAGSVSVSGFLFFSDGLGNAEDDHTLQDEFYGGMSVGWTWGG